MYLQQSVLILPNSLKQIGDYSFAANRISQVEIGPNVATIGIKGPFAANYPLMKIIVDENNENFCHNDQFSLYSKNMTVLYQATGYNTTFIIPLSVTKVLEQAFDNIRTKSVYIPSNVTLSYNSFYHMPNLNVVYLSSYVSSSSVFDGCSSLRYLYYYNDIAPPQSFIIYCPKISKVFVINPNISTLSGYPTTLILHKEYYTCNQNYNYVCSWSLPIHVFIVLLLE